MHWRVRREQATPHAHVYLTIFVAEKRFHTHANVGEICLRPDEAEEFINLLKADISNTSND